MIKFRSALRKLTALFMTLVFCLILPVRCYAAETQTDSEPKINAKAAVLMCLDTGDILYEKNMNERLYPASVTKVMSILLFFEALDSGKIKATDKVKASENAVAMGGSQIWLENGEEMTVNELLRAVIIASANDACTALGEYVAGSSSAFVKMMNDKAKTLNLKNTRFENCTGLDDTAKSHYSSAYDLAVISRELMKHKSVTDYTCVRLDSLRNGKTQLTNTNKLINSYNGITGLKTGTTSKAGFCISATASRDSMNLVAVVLGSDTSDDRFAAAETLLDNGFDNYSLVKCKYDNSKIKSITVSCGSKKEIKPVVYDNSPVLVEKGNEESVKYVYDVKDSVQAPIKKGDVLGNVTVYSNGKKIKEVNLVSSQNILRITSADIFKKILSNI